MDTANQARKPRGRPFERGDDPRRNLGGRRQNPATAALRAVADDARLEAMWSAGLAAAQAGDVRWAALVVSYLDGKPIARAEQGEPGDFEKPDFSEFSTEELRAAIRSVQG